MCEGGEEKRPANTDNMKREIFPFARIEKELASFGRPRRRPGAALGVCDERSAVRVQRQSDDAELGAAWVLVLHGLARKDLLQLVIAEALIHASANNVVLFLTRNRAGRLREDDGGGDGKERDQQMLHGELQGFECKLSEKGRYCL